MCFKHVLIACWSIHDGRLKSFVRVFISIILALKSVDILPLFEVFLVLAMMRIFTKTWACCIMLWGLWSWLKSCLTHFCSLGAAFLLPGRGGSPGCRLSVWHPGRAAAWCCWVGIRALVTQPLAPCHRRVSCHAVGARTAQNWLTGMRAPPVPGLCDSTLLVLWTSLEPQKGGGPVPIHPLLAWAGWDLGWVFPVVFAWNRAVV